MKRGFWLLLCLLMGGFVGFAVGLNAGAGWMGIHPRERMEVYAYLLGAGAAGGLGVILGRSRGSWLNLFWLIVGAGVGLGTAALAGAIGWWWIETSTSLTLALLVWGGILGGMWGVARNRPISGILMGVLLLGLVVGMAWLLGHADPAALFGAVVGLLAGTMLWGQIRPSRVWLARLSASGLVLITGIALCVFRGELGAQPVRVFMPSESLYSYSGKGSNQLPAPVFSPDGQRLLSTDGHNVYLWDVASGRRQHTFPVKSSRAQGYYGEHCFSFTFDDNNVPLLIVLERTEVQMWHVETRERLGTWPVSAAPGSGSVANSLVLSPDGHLVLVAHLRSGYYDGPSGSSTAAPFQFWVIDLRKKTSTPHSLEKVPAVGSMALSPRGNQLLLGCSDGTVRLWDIGSDQEQRVSRTHEGSLHALAFSPNGSHAYALGGKNRGKDQSYGNYLIVWKVPEWTDFQTLQPERNDGFTCAAFSRNRNLLLTGTSTGYVHLWDVRDQTKLRTFRHHRSIVFGRSGGIEDVAISRDDHYGLSVDSYDSMLKLWELGDHH